MYYQYPDYLQQLEQRIRQLEQQNEQLQASLEQIKPVHIENINYKIQELAVRELKGTLNIGMTALNDPEEIKKWLSEAEGEDVHLEDLEQDGSTEQQDYMYSQSPHPEKTE